MFDLRGNVNRIYFGDPVHMGNLRTSLRPHVRTVINIELGFNIMELLPFLIVLKRIYKKRECDDQKIEIGVW